jgi:hypothetical protein
MKPIIRFQQVRALRAGLALLSPLVFVCLGISHMAQAVVPPPDGGYPNFNTAEGQNALFSLSTGVANTAVGAFSLRNNTNGALNTAVGAGTLLANTADNNTAIGGGALLSNTTGVANTASGALALFNNTTGTANTAVGIEALYFNTAGSANTAIGDLAGFHQATGSNNVYIGADMAGVAGESNACYIKSIFGQTSANGIPVLINSDNKLGTTTSSKHFKKDIRAMAKASEALFTLKPVTFHYKKEIDPAGTSQFGLVAEDVEKVNPDLVVRDKQGNPYSVRYDQVNAMLLNEFLKEHKNVQKQGSTIAELKKEIASLTATVKEQAAQIQSVSAQIETSKAVTLVASLANVALREDGKSP